MMIGFIAVITLQALVMAVDEFYCHYRRELPRWERWGHPLDTFFSFTAVGTIGFYP